MNQPQDKEEEIITANPILVDIILRLERLEKALEIMDKRMINHLGLEGYKSAWNIYEEKKEVKG